MKYSKAQRQAVYLAWKSDFSTSQCSSLRKQKAIRAYLQRHYPFTRLSAHLVGIIQSLLRDGIFQSTQVARQTFPDLFRPLTPVRTQRPTAESQVTGSSAKAAFGRDESSKELLTGLQKCSVLPLFYTLLHT